MLVNSDFLSVRICVQIIFCQNIFLDLSAFYHFIFWSFVFFLSYLSHVIRSIWESSYELAITFKTCFVLVFLLMRLNSGNDLGTSVCIYWKLIWRKGIMTWPSCLSCLLCCPTTWIHCQFWPCILKGYCLYWDAFML